MNTEIIIKAEYKDNDPPIVKLYINGEVVSCVTELSFEANCEDPFPKLKLVLAK